MTTTTTAPALTPEDFDYVRAFLKKESAINLEDGKEYLVTSRLAPLVRSHEAADLAELIAQLRRRPTSPLGAEVIDAMTTNETSFFRDIHPFQTLRDTILPELIAARQTSRSLSIWCGASSSGQEPYSIAMSIREHFPELANWRIKITATDISDTILAKAESGTYSQLEVNRGMPAPMMIKYFSRTGARWQVSDEIRQMVHFAKMNLDSRWLTMQPQDLIFLRNVLIYFNDESKIAILKQARSKLADDGYLILGGAETTVGAAEHYERMLIGRSVWYRAA